MSGIGVSLGKLARQQRRLGMIEAAEVADRYGDKLMREAEKHHDEEDWDRYEELEGMAVIASSIATKIRRASKRAPKPT